MSEQKEFCVDRKEIEKQLQMFEEEERKPAILICGQTGAGKSSVVNYIFKGDVASVSHSKPETRGIRYYSNEFLDIYDSEGYEIGSESQARYEKIIFDDFIDKRNDNSHNAVHVVWYAISGANKRVTELDARLIKRMKDAGYKVCVVLTKIDVLSESQFTDMIKAIKSFNVECFPVSVLDEKHKELKEFTKWDELTAWTNSVIPEVCKYRFVAALKRGAKEKYEQGNSITNKASLSAAAAAATPVPFSDALLLVPIQSAMLTKIAALYEVEIDSSLLAGFLSSTLVTNIGKSLAGNLLKLIPFLGTIGGAALNATIATGITKAMGTAFNESLYKSALDIADGKKSAVNIIEILNSLNFLNRVKELISSK